MPPKTKRNKANKYKVLHATIAAAVKVLDVTGSVLETTPIPGAAAVIKVILDIIEQKEVRTPAIPVARTNKQLWTQLAGRFAELADTERQHCEDLVKLMDAYQNSSNYEQSAPPSELQESSRALAK